MTIIFAFFYTSTRKPKKKHTKKLSKGKVVKDERGVYAKPKFEID